MRKRVDLISTLGAISILLVVGALTSQDVVRAQAVPAVMAHQGRLLDSGGTPVTTPTSVTFQFWDAASGGTMLSSQTQTITPDAQGFYETFLNLPASPLPANLYLQLIVAGTSLTPRLQFGSVAYAAKAGGLECASCDIGVGTTSPVTITGGRVVDVENPAGAAVLRLGDGGGVEWELQSTVIGTAAMNLSNITDSTNPLTIMRNGNVGVNTTGPNARLQVNGGDIAVGTQGQGLILHATDGPNCYRLSVNNSGSIATQLVTCP